MASVYFPRPERSLLLTLGATALVAVKPVFAQGTNTNTNRQQETDAPPETEEKTETDPPPPETTKKDDPPPPAKTTDNPPPPAKTSQDKEEEITVEEDDPPVITKTGEDGPPPTMTDPPTITGGIGGGGGILTDAPSLTRGNGIPTYPPASVPPVYMAPYMHHSRAPDGTVFIAVGAILGAFGLGILIWRVIVGLLLHRSVERAALAQHDANSKASFPAPPAPFYKYSDQASNMSLPAARSGARKSTRGPFNSNNVSQSNLFFSPTAAASSGNTGNRASAFLPSGFYAGVSGNQTHGQSISMTNLRPESQGGSARHSRITPPDSPAFAARREMSTSSLNVHSPAGPRAPSAYLEDLLADDPGALPPPHMLPSAGPRRSPGPQGRF